MAENDPRTGIAVLGASGLIGQAIALGLMRDGLRVIAAARRFTPAQEFAFGGSALPMPIAALDADALAQFLTQR